MKNFYRNFDFEKALGELQKIVNELENDKLSLDKSLKLYEEGVRLGRLCHQKLKSVEQRIEILTKENDEGYETSDFESDVEKE